MAELLTGTVTFLFTDIEGLTQVWEQHPHATRLALARHHSLVAAGIEQHGGVVVKSQGDGDSVFPIFAPGTDALAAPAAVEQVLQAERWPAETPLRVA
jgi:class 3 adenylate cyclase